MVVMILFSSNAYSTQINNCTTIATPGYYELTTDILEFGNATPCDAVNCVYEYQACILINSSDVYLNCNGHYITGNLSIVYTNNLKPPAGIVLNNINNVTISNCNLYNLTYPLRASSISGLNLENISFDIGMYLEDVNGSVNNLTGEGFSFNRFMYDSMVYCGGNPCPKMWYLPSEVPQPKSIPPTLYAGLIAGVPPELNITNSFFRGQTPLYIRKTISLIENVSLEQEYPFDTGMFYVTEPIASILSEYAILIMNFVNATDVIDYSLFPPTSVSIGAYFLNGSISMTNSIFKGYNITMLIDTNDCSFHNNLFNASGSYAQPYWNDNFTCSWNDTNYGNYWGLINGTGYSDTCIDSNNDKICDSPYDILGDGTNIDYLPLSEYVTGGGAAQIPPPNTSISFHTEDNLLEVYATINQDKQLYELTTDLVVSINGTNYTATGMVWTDSYFGNLLEIDPTYLFQKVLPPGEYNVTAYMIWNGQIVNNKTINFTVGEQFSDWLDYNYPKRIVFDINSKDENSNILKLTIPKNKTQFIIKEYELSGNAVVEVNKRSSLLVAVNNNNPVDYIYFSLDNAEGPNAGTNFQYYADVTVATNSNDVNVGDKVYIYYGYGNYTTKSIFKNIPSLSLDLGGILDVPEDVYLYGEVAIPIDRQTVYYITSNGNVMKYYAGQKSYLYSGHDAISLEIGGFQDAILGLRYYYICVLTNKGNVYCYNEGNAPDVGQIISYTKGDAIQVSAGPRHICILTKQHDVHCYGSNETGQLIEYSGAKQVMAAGSHTINHGIIGRTCVLDENNTAHCFGSMNGTYQNVTYLGAIQFGFCALHNNASLICYCDPYYDLVSDVVNCSNNYTVLANDVVFLRSEFDAVAYMRKDTQNIHVTGSSVLPDFSGSLVVSFDRYIGYTDYVVPAWFEVDNFVYLKYDPNLYLSDLSGASTLVDSNAGGYIIYPTYGTVASSPVIFAQTPIELPRNVSVYVFPRQITLYFPKDSDSVQSTFVVGVKGDEPVYITFDASSNIKKYLLSPELNKRIFIDANSEKRFLLKLKDGELPDGLIGTIIVSAELPDGIKQIPIHVMVYRHKPSIWKNNLWILLLILILFILYESRKN